MGIAHFVIKRFLLLILLLASTIYPASAAVVRESGLVRVEAPDQYAKYADAIVGHANAALRHLHSKTGDSLLVPVTFQLIATEREFIEEAGSIGENSLAVAFGGQNRVIINREAISQNASDRIEAVLAHELAHVYLDVKCRGPVPHWVHEGVAQMVAGEWMEAPSAMALAVASFTGGLIPAKDLVERFPSDITRRNQAYAQAYSFTRYIVREDFGNSLPSFLTAIRGDDGAAYLRSLSSSLDLLELENAWQRELRSPGTLLWLIASSGFLWGVAMVLVVLAYLVKRRRSQHLRRQWAREEMLAAEFGSMPVPSAFSDTGDDPWSEESEDAAGHFMDQHVAEGELYEKDYLGLEDDDDDDDEAGSYARR